jgi:N-acetylneuraminic acid mutarotase
LPAARQEHCVAAAKGKVYVLGGYAPQVTDSVLAYDPATKAWTDAQSFPEPMNHCQVGVINDVMYVAGYYINGTMSTATDKAYSYDPDADEWVSISPLPSGTDRAAGCVAVTDGLMYVVGGAHDGTSVDDVARYDPVSDSWETLPNLPERREHCAAGAIDGIVYVAGGRADGITGIEEKTWAYDPAAMTWTQKKSLAPPRGGLAGAVLAGRFIVFGGEGNEDADSGVFPNINAYDPLTDSWEDLPPMASPRHGYGAATIGDRIYLPGGATHQGGGAGDDVSVFYFE